MHIIDMQGSLLDKRRYRLILHWLIFIVDLIIELVTPLHYMMARVMTSRSKLATELTKF